MNLLLHHTRAQFPKKVKVKVTQTYRDNAQVKVNYDLPAMEIRESWMEQVVDKLKKFYNS